MNDHADSPIAAWIALLLFGIYLLSFSGQFYSQDSMLMFSVAESFVKRGEFSADQMWTIYKARNELGPDGEAYSKTGYGASLMAAPLYALGLALPGEPGLLQVTLLTSSLVIALTGALLFLSARRLGFSRRASVVTALLFGLATPAWVYAKQFWSEPYALFTLFAAFYFLLRLRDQARSRDALIAGVALGLAVAVRVTNAALVPVFVWYGFWRGANKFAATIPQSRPASAASVVGGGRLGAVVDAVSNRRDLRGLAWFTLALGVIALSIAYYNWARYGSPLSTGYRADETFDNPILLGLYGLLFSPGKGLFVYVPFLAALPWSAFVFFRRARRETILALVTFAFYLLPFSLWYYWWGGTNWGPRFLVPTLPFLVLLSAPAVEQATRVAATKPPNRPSPAQRSFAAILLALCLLSFAFELVGVSVPSLAYRARMVRFSANPEWDAIFLPSSSPLIGSLNLIKPSVLDFAWIRASGGDVSIDWLVIALTVAFIVFCVLSLRAQFAKHSPDRELGIASRKPLAMTVAVSLAIALSIFSLHRYREDPRFGGSDGYRALLQTIRREEQPNDVMILADDTRAPFFLNENRARLRWYGLSRDPQQWDDATRARLTRLSKQFARIWFVYDDATAALPDPVGAWLSQSFKPIDERDFGDGARLMLFATTARP